MFIVYTLRAFHFTILFIICVVKLKNERVLYVLRYFWIFVFYLFIFKFVRKWMKLNIKDLAYAQCIFKTNSLALKGYLPLSQDAAAREFNLHL